MTVYPNALYAARFNTQPPEGGWENRKVQKRAILMVSTHSRLKAAGYGLSCWFSVFRVSTHSRLKAAGFLH